MHSAEATSPVPPPQAETVIQIPLSELRPFPNHPFKVRDDEAMRGMMESVSQYGVLTPAIVRPRSAGGYEIISGHRRKHASEAAGLDTIPAIVRDMDDDAATILMVDSNIQREDILPSEKAQAYKMKLEAIKRQGARTDLTSRRVGEKLEAPPDKKRLAADVVGSEAGESGRQVQRFIRLAELLPVLQGMVDKKQLAFHAAVELSHLKPEEQALVIEAMNSEQTVPTLTQAQQLKRNSQEGGLDRATVLSILSADTPSTVRPPAHPKPPKPEATEDTSPRRERTSHIAEDILRLKDTTKECRCTPEMFLSAFGEYVSRSRREMEVFLIPFYAEIFPALSPEHMAGLQRQISDIHAAADKFYNDVKGRNEDE